MNTKNESLETAYATRARARVIANAAAAALKRGERLAIVATEKVSDLEKELSTLEGAEAERLAATIAGGVPTPAAPRVAVGGLAAELAALAAAKSHASVHARALDSLQAASARAQAELAAAEAAVIAAVDGILEAGDIEIARQLSHHLSEALRIGSHLLLLTIAGEMSQRRQPHPEVAAVLAQFDTPLFDRRHVALNSLKFGDQAAVARLSARRDQLIAGEISPRVADAAA